MRKALLNLTMEQTVKLLGVILIAVFAFGLAAWGVDHVRTLGDYIGFHSSSCRVPTEVGSVEGSGTYVAGVCNERKPDKWTSDEMVISVSVANAEDSPQEVWVRLRPPSGTAHHLFNQVVVGGGELWNDCYNTNGVLQTWHAAKHFDDGYRVQVWAPDGDEWPSTFREDELELLDEFSVDASEVPHTGDSTICTTG